MALPLAKGNATFNGIAGTFDVIVYPVSQEGRLTQNWEEEIVKDVNGSDTAWLARNEHHMLDLAMKLIGPTAANAAAGGVFLAPLTSVNLSGFGLSPLNGQFQVTNGSDIAAHFDKVGDISFKLRQYADPNQNALANTTPS